MLIFIKGAKRLKTFLIQQTTLLKNNFEISDEFGQLLLKTEGNVGGLVGLRNKVYDATTNQEIAFIKQRFGQYKFDIFQNEKLVATVKKSWLSLGKRYIVDGINWEVKGQLVKHQYTIAEKNGTIIAECKKSFSFKDKFEVSIIKDSQDPILVFLVIIALDSIINQMS